MTIQEIYEKFDNIGCLTFATINNDYPETRIAHFRGYDENGIYFMTMYTKPFYKQLKETGKVSVCGLCASSKVEELEDGSPVFEAGYFARLTGDVVEVSLDELKAKNNPIFDFCIEDNRRYPTMVTFCITKFHGEIFKYDFEKIEMDHKILRTRFSYNDAPMIQAGLNINNQCIQCGKCARACTFDAIYKDTAQYQINGSRCDECGSCFLVCPVNAISHKGL